MKRKQLETNPFDDDFFNPPPQTTREENNNKKPESVDSNIIDLSGRGSSKRLKVDSENMMYGNKVSIPARKDETVLEYSVWKAKEEEFHLSQAKLRSQIRLQQHREQPIDIFSTLIAVLSSKQPITEDFFLPHYREPYLLLKTFTSIKHLENLLLDITLHAKLDVGGIGDNFWGSLTTIVQFILDIAKGNISDLPGDSVFQLSTVDENIYYTTAIHLDVDEDIKYILQKEDYEGLKSIQTLIKTNLFQKNFQYNIQFWDTILQRIQITKVHLFRYNIHIGKKLFPRDI